jgi:AraC-type DNA-binding domain-containing proteins
MKMEFKHELILPNDDLPFKMFLFEGKDGNYRVAKHWHRSIEIFLVLEGQMEFFINHVRYPLSAVDFVIVNSNEIHRIEVPEPNRTVVVQIPLVCLKDYFDEDDYVLFSRRTPAGSDRLIRLITEMFAAYQQKQFAYELKVKGLFMELLYLLITEFMSKEEDLSSIRQKKQLDKLSKITSYMKANYNQDITLNSVADQFGFSPTYLSRMFRKYANVNYKTYLLNLRTEYGLKEMMNTDHSLSEIAFNNGFPNSRAFAKAFQKRYFCLPSEYRKRMQEEI